MIIISPPPSWRGWSQGFHQPHLYSAPKLLQKHGLRIQPAQGPSLPIAKDSKGVEHMLGDDVHWPLLEHSQPVDTSPPGGPRSEHFILGSSKSRLSLRLPEGETYMPGTFIDVAGM